VQIELFVVLHFLNHPLYHNKRIFLV
jgi:hypothetical protein